MNEVEEMKEWTRFRNNNGEWISEAHIIAVSEETAEALESIAKQCGMSLSRQKCWGTIWFYRYELDQLEEGLTTESILDAYTKVMDDEKFRQSFEKAKSGDVKAQYQLGFCYQFGVGVEENVWEAVKWYTKAAEQGVAEAQFFLANCYQLGEGVEQNDVEAVKWLMKAAEQGNATAQYFLSECYSKGKGVTQDMDKATMWLNKAKQNDKP